MPAAPKTYLSAAANRAGARSRPPSDFATALIELRDRLTVELDAGPPASALASLGRELRSTLIELAGVADIEPNDQRARLQRLAGLLSAAMDSPDTSPAAVAALAREKRATLAELASVVDNIDDETDFVAVIRARREARLAAIRDGSEAADEGSA